MKPGLDTTEKLLYILYGYGAHHKWSYHSDINMSFIDKLPLCVECDQMDKAKKRALPKGYPKVKKTTAQIQVSEPINQFMFPDGTYHLWVN